MDFNPSQISTLLPLLKKYSKPGPRYTSYPTAPVFGAGYNAKDHTKNIMLAGEEISLYVHLPFCDTLCYFCGCTMLVSNNRSKIAEYLGYLEREIKMAGELAVGSKVVQLHWGGGTPTHLTPSEIYKLGSLLRKHFMVAEDAEISVEIDPREVTADHIQALSDVGFRRASIGVQDMNEQVQRAINRIQPESVTRQVIQWCREKGFESINIDLIYGLPLQTRELFAETVQRVLTLTPDRLALYNFAYIPRLKAHQKLIQISDLPESDEKLFLFADATEAFLDSGYEYIGMDHFAKPDDELAKARIVGTLQRNFQGYSTRGDCNLLGLGMSGISHINGTFSQNEKSLDQYYQKLDRGSLPVRAGLAMSFDDSVREHIIMRLMCDLRLDKRTVSDLFDMDFDDYFSSSIDQLCQFETDGLVILTPNSIEITSKGRFFIRNIAMCFDAYLEKEPKHQPLFSKTL